MTDPMTTDLDLAAEIADEYLTLAALLESASPDVWDVPSLCEGWRTREVVAHVTMPARYGVPEFMARGIIWPSSARVCTSSGFSAISLSPTSIAFSLLFVCR